MNPGKLQTAFAGCGAMPPGRPHHHYVCIVHCIHHIFKHLLPYPYSRYSTIGGRRGGYLTQERGLPERSRDPLAFQRLELGPFTIVVNVGIEREISSRSKQRIMPKDRRKRLIGREARAGDGRRVDGIRATSPSSQERQRRNK